MSFKYWIVIPGAALLFAGCNAGHRSAGSADAALGDSAKWNAAVQTINPDPVYTEQGAQPGGSGAKGAEAVERYRTDNIKDVRVLTTTSDPGASDPR